MELCIFGRAVSGVGGAGIYSACIYITCQITTLSQQVWWILLFGVCFGCSTVIGPIIGGHLTDGVVSDDRIDCAILLNQPAHTRRYTCRFFLLTVSNHQGWRWIYWINLPIGGFAGILLVWCVISVAT